MINELRLPDGVTVRRNEENYFWVKRPGEDIVGVGWPDIYKSDGSSLPNRLHKAFIAAEDAARGVLAEPGGSVIKI